MRIFGWAVLVMRGKDIWVAVLGLAGEDIWANAILVLEGEVLGWKF